MTRAQSDLPRTARRLARTPAAAAVIMLLAAACSTGAGPEPDATAAAPAADSAAAAAAEHSHAADAGCHTHDKGETYHTADGEECHIPGGGIDDEDVIPAARGEMTPGLLLTSDAGGDLPVYLPEPTPGVIAWSDWCFFDMGKRTVCAQELTRMSYALDFLGADEACVLEQHRLFVESAGMNRSERLNEFGWHQCASVIDPEPGDGRSWVQKCEALPNAGTFAEDQFGGCEGWRDYVQPLVDIYGAPDCTLAINLGILWMQGEWFAGNLSEETVKASLESYLGQCG